MTIEEVALALELADALDDGTSIDGTHIGITDSSLCARALRAFAAGLLILAPAEPIATAA